MTFGERLRKARKEAGLTQEQLGKKLSVLQPAVGHWERGLREPSIAMIRQIAIILECDANYLLGIID